MSRRFLMILLSLLIALPAAAQKRVPAPPSDDNEPSQKRRRRAPPAPTPHRPVRPPVDLTDFVPGAGAAGIVVEIKGDHFDETCQVRFNGRFLRIIKWEKKLLKVKIPPKAVTGHFVIAKAGFRENKFDRPFHVVRKPLIRVFSPRKAGPGEDITVVGNHFLPDDAFMLGPTRMKVVSFRPDRVVAKVPEGQITAHIMVSRKDKTLARTKHPLQVVGPRPVIESFMPKKGNKGTVVRIEGQNFEPPDKVLLSGRKLKVLRRSRTFLDVQIGPRCTSGTFQIRGLFGRRTESSDIFTMIRPPKLSRFNPRYGVAGTIITVEGVGFLEGDQVFIGEGVLTVRTVSHNRIVAELPAGVESGIVHVVREGKKFFARGRFEVIHAPQITDISPMDGPPGTPVVIQGNHFLPRLSVLLAGQKIARVRRVSANEISVQVPPGARTGRVVVITRAGSVQSAVPFKVTQAATVSSFFPLHGLPGTRVVIRGDHFHPGIKVLLGATSLAVKKVEPRELEVEIPEGAPTSKFLIETRGRKLSTKLAFTVDQPKPEVAFKVVPQSGRRGSEVTLLLTPPRQEVLVVFNDRPLPKKVLQGGARIVVTIPGDARTGFFELEYNGRRYRAEKPFKVR